LVAAGVVPAAETAAVSLEDVLSLPQAAVNRPAAMRPAISRDFFMSSLRLFTSVAALAAIDTVVQTASVNTPGDGRTGLEDRVV
jgi:hypothetical protein